MRILALDLGAKTITFCEVSSAGVVIGRGTVGNVEALRFLLGPDQSPARVAIEACREAWFVHDLLVSWDNDVLLVDTTRSKQLGIGQHGRKTDRIDAETLARALARGGLPLAHILSPSRRELRDALGVRRSLVESRAQMVTTARGLAREKGVRLPSCDTEHFVTKVRELALETPLKATLELLLTVLATINAQLVKVDVELLTLCEKEPVINLLSTVPGVGTIVAACFVSVIDEARRFRSAHAVEAYLGLVPNENSSGGKRRLGAITKKGNPYARAMLVQAAWSILRSADKSDPLRLWAEGVAKRRGKRIAVVALARRLVGVMYAMWRDGTFYDAPHLSRAGVRGLRRAQQTIEQQREALEAASKKRSRMKAHAATASVEQQKEALEAATIKRPRMKASARSATAAE